MIKERSSSSGAYTAVLDERGTEAYRIRKKVFSPREKVAIEDLSGGELASVHRHLILLPLTYEIRIGGEKVAEIRRKVFTRSDDWLTIDVTGNDDLQVKGDLTNHEYVIERDGDEVAEISTREVATPDTYAVRVVGSVDPLLVIGSVIGLEMLLERIANDAREAETEADDDEDDD